MPNSNACKPLYQAKRRLRVGILGQFNILRLRQELTDEVEAKPHRYLGLLHDVKLAWALDVHDCCRYVRMECVASVFDNTIYDRIHDCADGNSDVLILDIATMDLELQENTPEIVAQKILSLAKFAYLDFGFRVVVLVSAVYIPPMQVSDRTMASRIVAVNSILRQEVLRNPRIRFVQIKSLQFMPDSSQERPVAAHLDEDGRLTTEAFARFRHNVKHIITSTFNYILNRYPDFRA